mmetsp:Transcript_4692/g.10101  ORF Transcript_4692/g.10101 Transcript_4692/m.10101 type:complete len:234 (-) Transcript_4692:90-791(-)
MEEVAATLEDTAASVARVSSQRTQRPRRGKNLTKVHLRVRVTRQIRHLLLRTVATRGIPPHAPCVNRTFGISDRARPRRTRDGVLAFKTRDQSISGNDVANIRRVAQARNALVIIPCHHFWRFASRDRHKTHERRDEQRERARRPASLARAATTIAITAFARASRAHSLIAACAHHTRITVQPHAQSRPRSASRACVTSAPNVEPRSIRTNRRACGTRARRDQHATRTDARRE